MTTVRPSNANCTRSACALIALLAIGIASLAVAGVGQSAAQRRAAAHKAYVAGQFYRGGRRGNDGRQVNAIERDRVRALQLLNDAKNLAADDPDTNAVAELYFQFAEVLLDNRFGNGAWLLQSLSDLSKLPDY